jgi:hypothetical protein
VVDGGQSGFATLQTVVAAGLAMVFFAVLANLVVMQYSLGVVTAALDEGVRQGARSAAPVASCLERIDSTLSAIEGGGIGADPSTACVVDGGWLVATLDGRLLAWAPMVPEVAFTREARAPLEDRLG